MDAPTSSGAVGTSHVTSALLPPRRATPATTPAASARRAMSSSRRTMEFMSTPLSYGWEIQFRLAYLERTAQAFHELFAQIMERRDIGFQRVRPWGKQGDRKNDGWSPSRRTLFQCYAPSTLNAATLENKLIEDYEGALPFWRQYFDTWVFVHNDLDGAAPTIARRIAELDARSIEISAQSWGFPELRNEFAALDDNDRQAILGPPLTTKDFLGVDASTLRPLIEALGHMIPDHSDEIRPVPLNKVEVNQLAPAQVEFLKIGSRRAPLVDHYLTNAYVLPSHADAIATAVSDRYQRFCDRGMSPSSIFDHMVAWMCAGTADSTTRASALAILAYFFDRCQIFEIPGEGLYDPPK